MKKVLIGVFCLGLIIVSTGCFGKKGNNEKKTVYCTINNKNAGNLVLNTSYKIECTGKYIDSIETVETVETSDSEVLSTYKNSLDNFYKPYENIDYYVYSVTLEGNVLTNKLSVDYTKVDTDKLITINRDNASLIKDGKIEYETMKQIYEQLGATCK